MIKNSDMNAEDHSIYAFGLEHHLADIMQAFVLFLVAFISRTVVQITLFSAFFTVLKRFAGGYHAPSHFSCIVGFTGVALLFAWITLNLPPTAGHLIAVSCLLPSSYLVVRYAPRKGSKNHRSPGDQERCRRISILVLMVEAVIILAVLILFPVNSVWPLSACFGCLAAAVSIVIPSERRVTRNAKKRFSAQNQ